LTLSATEIALIEAAERQFAMHGIDGASLRQISIDAGLVNSYAVQYHFKNRDGLVQAIFDYRIGVEEQEMQRILDRLELEGRTGDIRLLIDAVWRHVFMLRDGHGQRSYGAFLLGLRRSRSGFMRRLAVSYLSPATNRLMELLRIATGLPADVFMRRFELITAMQLDSLSRADADDPLYRGLADEKLLGELVAMAEAALLVPNS
jgi:AcrR family transcriptional regulator